MGNKKNRTGKKRNNEDKKYPKLRPLWLGVFSDIIGFSLLITVYPSLSQKYGLSPFENGLILSINGFFSFFSAPVWGSMSDKYGRKPMLLISQFGTIMGFLFLAFSQNITMIVVSRIIDGVFGGNFPISKAVINDVVKPKDMSTQLTNVGIAHNVANMFGPALGGVLFVRFGIVGPGLLAAFTGIFSFVATYFMLDETAPVKMNPKLYKKAIKSEDFANEKDNEKNHIENISNENRLGMENYQRNTTSISNQIPEGKWYEHKELLAALFLLGFSAIGFITIISNLSMFGLLKLNLDAQAMGIFLMIAGAIQITIRFTIFVPSLRKFGEYNLVFAGFIMYLVIFPLLGFVLSPTHLLILMIINSFATSSTRGGINAFISKLARPHERGKVQGISSSLDTFAQVLGPIMGGAVLTYIPLQYFGVIPFGFMSVAFGILLGARKMKKAIEEKDKKDMLASQKSKKEKKTAETNLSS